MSERSTTEIDDWGGARPTFTMVNTGKKARVYTTPAEPNKLSTVKKNVQFAKCPPTKSHGGTNPGPTINGSSSIRKQATPTPLVENGTNKRNTESFGNAMKKKRRILNTGDSGISGHLGTQSLNSVGIFSPEVEAYNDYIEALSKIPKPVFRWKIGDSWDQGVARYNAEITEYQALFENNQRDAQELRRLKSYLADINYVNRVHGVPEISWVKIIPPPKVPQPPAVEWSLYNAYKANLAAGIHGGNYFKAGMKAEIPANRSICMPDIAVDQSFCMPEVAANQSLSMADGPAPTFPPITRPPVRLPPMMRARPTIYAIEVESDDFTVVMQGKRLTVSGVALDCTIGNVYLFFARNGIVDEIANVEIPKDPVFKDQGVGFVFIDFIDEMAALRGAYAISGGG